MDLNDVILTLKELDELDEQFKKLPINVRKSNGKGGLDRAWQNWVDFKNKAQCLKLLVYLRENEVLDHSYHSGAIIVEIEKLLKEQND